MIKVKSNPNLNGWYNNYQTGSSFHYKQGLWHNEDGPAVVWSIGPCSYYLEGVLYPNISSDLEWLLTVKKWKKKFDKSS
jgi:hypothetical protein